MISTKERAVLSVGEPLRGPCRHSTTSCQLVGVKIRKTVRQASACDGKSYAVKSQWVRLTAVRSNGYTTDLTQKERNNDIPAYVLLAVNVILDSSIHHRQHRCAW